MVLTGKKGIEWVDRSSSSQHATVPTSSDSDVSIQQSTLNKHQLKRKSVFDEGERRTSNLSFSVS
jgi:hypothetical protein